MKVSFGFMVLALIGLGIFYWYSLASGGVSFTMEGYKEAVRSGRRQIPETNQIEELFGNSDHFIGHHGDRSLGNDWSTVAYFYDRYVLTMKVDVKVPYSFDKVETILSEPRFTLNEVEKVTFHSGGDVVGASFGAQHRFSLKDWKKLYEANGDFSVIGIDVKKDRPVKDFGKYVVGKRDDRIQVEFNENIEFKKTSNEATNDKGNKESEELK